MIHNNKDHVSLLAYDETSDRVEPRDSTTPQGRADDWTEDDTILISSLDYARLKLDLLGIFRLKWLSQ